MAKLAAVTCETVKPNKARDRLVGDGDGLFLRIRPNGTKTWVIEYDFKGERRKYTVGLYVPTGAPGASIGQWLRHGRLSLTQARAIAGEWKAARRAGHDPVIEWEAQLEAERAEEVARANAIAAEENQPTVRDAVEQFMAKIIDGKKSAPAIRYRLDRLAAFIGDKKIRDVTRKDVIAALDTIAEGQREGRTAKQLCGEVLTQTKRLWRFARSREWVAASCVEELTRRDFDAKPTRRDVTLRLDELAAVWRTLDDPEQCKAHPLIIAAMKLLILTGQRESEVAEAEWTEFDLTAGLWKIPAQRAKSKRAHLVHLAPQAVAILEAMKVLTRKKRYVFESPLKRGHPRVLRAHAARRCMALRRASPGHRAP